LPGSTQINRRRRHRLDQSTPQAHRQAPDLRPLICSIPQGPKEIGYWETAPGSAIWWALQEENSPLLEKKRIFWMGWKFTSVIALSSEFGQGVSRSDWLGLTSEYLDYRFNIGEGFSGRWTEEETMSVEVRDTWRRKTERGLFSGPIRSPHSVRVLV